MPLPPPPVPQSEWDSHLDDQFDKSQQDADRAFADAQRAQERADAAAALDFEQRAEAQFQAATRPVYEAEEATSFALEADDQFERAASVARQARQRVDEQGVGAAPGGPGTTAGASSPPSSATSPRSRDGLARIYQDALAAGLDEEGARVAVAVAKTEGGLEGAVGDLDHNPLGAAGAFQFNFGGGMGNAYAKARGVSEQQARDDLARDPHSGNQYALTGYLGQAIREGQAKGLRGPALAEYAQRHGQRSVSPERAAANYAALQGQSFDKPAQNMALDLPPTPGAEKGQYSAARGPSRSEAVGQFEQGLPYEEASSICGPVAALAFVQANGRNPSLAEVRALAKQSGWTSQGGMNGVANQKALLDKLGVASRLDTDPDFGEISRDAASGNPVIISTGVHYYYVSGFNEQTGKLYVGKTGTSRKGGASWMSPQEIATLDGGINGALYVDNPNSPTPSVAAADDTGDRPPSEFEPPSRFAPGSGRSVGGSFAPILPDAALPQDPGRATIAEDAPLPDPLGMVEGGVTRLGAKAGEFNEASRAAFPDGRVASDEEAGRAMEKAEDWVTALTPEPLKKAGGKIVSGLLDAAGNPIRAAAGDVMPILDELGNIAKEVTVRAPKVDIPHPEFLQPEAALAPTHVPLVRQVFDRTRNVIGSMGEGGKELAQRVHAWREGAETDAAAFLQRMPTVKALKAGEFERVVDVLEGRAEASSPRIAQAAEEAKAVLDDLFSRAENAGVDVAERMGNYFPHVYKESIVDQLRDTKKRAEAIRHLMDTGQAVDEAEAIDKLSRFATTSRDRRHGSLEMARLANLPGYEKTKEALYGHILSATRRINEVAQFGPDDAIKDRLVTRMTAEGFEGDLANDLFKTIVGAKTYSKAAEDISRVARTWHTATRLGLAVLGNATQSVNTASVVGVVRTLRAAPKAVWSEAEQEFADRAGVTLDSVLKEVREGGGFSEKVMPKLLVGFNEVEKFNRRIAAIGGRDFAIDMAQKAANGSNGAARALVRLGLDPDAVRRAGGVLTDAEQIRAARSIVERTQFRVDPQDLPQWTSHPIGKMAAQFKTFSYNQTAFVKRELIDEARKGNVLPLVRFAILAPVAQAAATETRNALQGRESEEDPGMRVLQYALGPLGVAGDVSRTLFGINSKYVPIERRTAQFVGSLAGPTAGTATELLGAGLNALEGNLTPAARLALRQVPYAGGYLANTATPYKKAAPAATGSRSTPAPPRPPGPPKPPRPGR